MNLIEFFGLVIKPKITKGKYVFAPLENQAVNENIYALRDKDVNCFIYKKDDNMIAIDCGYKNSTNIPYALQELGLSAESVTHLFLTHLDLDHAGGIDGRCNCVFPNARLYLGNVEEGYLKHKLYRKKLAFIGLKTPIKLKTNYTLLDDRQVVYIGNIKIQAVHIAGHTMGHLCYLIDDKYLFSGDCLVLVKGIGYAFYSLWNIDNKLLVKSLPKLCELNNIEMIITSHSGYTKDIPSAFLNIDKFPNWKEKGYKVNDNAPYNPFAKG